MEVTLMRGRGVLTEDASWGRVQIATRFPLEGIRCLPQGCDQLSPELERELLGPRMCQEPA